MTTESQTPAYAERSSGEARSAKRKRVDFNSILTGANFVVAGLIFFRYLADQANVYIDQTTLLLGIVLCVQTHFALRLERRRRDPFVLWLAFETIVYFSLRLVTLTLYPFSVVFERYAYDARDSNFALLFMLIANVFIYFGLYAAGKKEDLRIDTRNRRPTSPWAVLTIVFITFSLTYFGGAYWPAGGAPRLFGILTVFFSPAVIIPMSLAYLFLFKRSLHPRFVWALCILLALELVAHTLWGSRSAMVQFAQSCLLVSFAVFGSVTISRKLVVLGVALLPIIAVVLVSMFTISTYNRMVKGSQNALDVEESIDMAKEAGSRFLVGPTLEILLPPILGRAGFFDFSAEVIAHRDQYSAVINLPAYARSVIDNILTPGFDVFDQPKIANSLLFLYRGWGAPSKQLLSVPGVYQSDQIGIYGELYTLFGYVSLPFFFLVAFTLKRVYIRSHGQNPFVLTMKRVVVLAIFVRTIDSFGFDWTIGEVLPLVVAVFLYAAFFASRRVASSGPELNGAAGAGAIG